MNNWKLEVYKFIYLGVSQSRLLSGGSGFSLSCLPVGRVVLKKLCCSSLFSRLTATISNVTLYSILNFIFTIVLLPTLLLLNLPARAQQKYNLTINGIPSHIKLTYNQTFTDSIQAYKQVDSVINQLKLNSFFNTNIDNFEWQNKHLTVIIKVGLPYKWLNISNGNINPNAFNHKKINGKEQFNTTQINIKYQNILSWYENNGYPFAQIWLDSLTFKNNMVTAKFYCNPNKKIFVDSVIIIGDAKLSPNYIYACLDIKPKSEYQENKIALIDTRLQNLNIISVLRNTEIGFAADKATINLYIGQKNANQFDGIIGFLPSQDGSKIQFTGDFLLKLQNTLKRGELINLNYRGLPNQTQQLLAKINYPYLLRSKIGLDADFQLFKKDTSFLNLNTKIGFSYAFNPDKAINIFIENYNGNLINTNNNVNTLPLFTNISTTYYGIGTHIEKTNNTLLPTKGYKINISASVGDRKINETKDFNISNFPAINFRSTQYKFITDFNYYLSLTPKFNFYIHNQASFISGNTIFENEAFRIGGFKTLRGFIEQSILVSSFMIQTIEARFFIEKKSFLFAFYDQAFTQQSFINSRKNDTPLGLGAGINFETKLGFMSLTYALGKQQNNPLNLRTGKIHFGLISNF